MPERERASERARQRERGYILANKSSKASKASEANKAGSSPCRNVEYTSKNEGN